MARKSIAHIHNQTSPKHTWSAEERTLLAVIERFYDVSTEERAALFNSLFSTKLADEGLYSGVTPGAIVAQINDLKRSARGVGFKKVITMRSQDAQTSFRHHRDKIEFAACKLGMTLKLLPQPMEEDYFPQNRCPLKVHRSQWSPDTESRSASRGQSHEELDVNSTKRQKLVQRHHKDGTHFMTKDTRLYAYYRDDTYEPSPSRAPSSEGSEDLGSEDTEAEANTFKEPGDEYFVETSTRIPPLLKVNFNHARQHVKKRPRLLFRAFEPAHGLTARRFLDPRRATERPPDYHTDAFCRMVEPHLREKESNSPFLSWTENPARALKIIAQAKGKMDQRSLAIVDYICVEQDLVQRYGWEACPYLVPVLCRAHTKLKGLRKVDSTRSETSAPGYTGVGEFLTWGSVECEAVAIIDSKCALELYKTLVLIKETVDEISYQSGAMLSRCLDDVHDKYKAVLAYKLIRVFRIGNFSSCKTTTAFREFVAGVYRERLGELSPGVSPESGKPTTSHEDWNLQSHLRENECELGDVALEPLDLSRFSFSHIQKQEGLSVEIPRASSSLLRGYKSTKQRAVLDLGKNDEIQDMVDSQLSAEGSLCGLLVYPFRSTQSPEHDGPGTRNSTLDTKVSHGDIPRSGFFPVNKSIAESEAANTKNKRPPLPMTGIERSIVSIEVERHALAETSITQESPHSSDTFSSQLFAHATMPSPAAGLTPLPEPVSQQFLLHQNTIPETAQGTSDKRNSDQNLKVEHQAAAVPFQQSDVIVKPGSELPAKTQSASNKTPVPASLTSPSKPSSEIGLTKDPASETRQKITARKPQHRGSKRTIVQPPPSCWRTTQRSTILNFFTVVNEETTTTSTTTTASERQMDANNIGEEDDVVIVSTARRRHNTILTIRSRSLSEAAFKIQPTCNPNQATNESRPPALKRKKIPPK